MSVFPFEMGGEPIKSAFPPIAMVTRLGFGGVLVFRLLYYAWVNTWLLEMFERSFDLIDVGDDFLRYCLFGDFFVVRNECDGVTVVTDALDCSQT